MADFLEGKPRGYCTWCGKRLLRFSPFKTYREWFMCDCHSYKNDLTEDENRIRYAAAKLEESKLWNKIEKEGGER